MIKIKMQNMQKSVSSKKKFKIIMMQIVLKIFMKNNKIRLKTQQRFKIEKRIVFTEEINKIALNSGDGKRM